MSLNHLSLEDFFWAIVFGIIGLLLISAAFSAGAPVVGFIFIGATLFVEYLCLGKH